MVMLFYEHISSFLAVQKISKVPTKCKRCINPPNTLLMLETKFQNQTLSYPQLLNQGWRSQFLDFFHMLPQSSPLGCVRNGSIRHIFLSSFNWHLSGRLLKQPQETTLSHKILPASFTSLSPVSHRLSIHHPFRSASHHSPHKQPVPMNQILTTNRPRTQPNPY